MSAVVVVDRVGAPGVGQYGLRVDVRQQMDRVAESWASMDSLG